MRPQRGPVGWNLMRASPTLLLLVLLAGGTVRAGESEAARDPDLRLPTIDGETFDLGSLRGRKVLLVEFASW